MSCENAADRSVGEGGRNLLIVAYAFPPHSVVGSLRPLRMVKYLKRISGWRPMVLTVDKDFARKDYSLLKEIPPDVTVHRSWTVEPSARLARMVALLEDHNPKGRTSMIRYGLKKICAWAMELLCIPDAEVFWNLSVIVKGRRIIRQESIDVLLVTSPPWSLQIAGYMLKMLTGVPWIADFRDPWTDIKRKNRPAVVDRMERWLEEKLLSQADLVLSTSDIYSDDLRKKYPAMDPGKFQTLHNGYDEEKFPIAEPEGNEKFTLVHLGSLYAQFKPEPLFDGIATWLSGRTDALGAFELLFIGQISAQTQKVLDERGLTRVTRVTGYVPHREAIEMCRRADTLLLALGTDAKMPRGWLPSKLFEYLALNRPILAYVADGEAASMVRTINGGYVVSQDDRRAIARILDDLFDRKMAHEKHVIPWQNDAEAMKRLQQAHIMKRLGSLLDSLRRRGSM